MARVVKYATWWVACALVLGMSWIARADAKTEVLLADDFEKDGPIDPQKWEMAHGKPPLCRGGILHNMPNKIWNSRQTFSRPVTLEFQGVRLGQWPRSGANALGLAPAGWAEESVVWVFDGSRRPGQKLVPLRRSEGRDPWHDALDQEINLREMPDITKAENAVNLRIDWWPGKVVRYYLNDQLVGRYTRKVPSVALPVGVRDESAHFQMDRIVVRRNAVPVDKVLAEIAAEKEAAARARKETERRQQAAAKVRREALLKRMSGQLGSLPEYALLLHLDGGDRVKDSSVYGFDLTPEGVSYERGRFGGAARFDGLRSRIVLDRPMIERPGYQYLSFCFHQQTVECRVRPERSNARETILGAVRWFNPHDPAHKLHGWQLLRTEEGRIVLDWGGKRIASASQAPPGRWTHVAAVIDGQAGRATLYLNGKAEGEAPVGMISTGGKFTIGAGDAGFYRGLIDEIAVYLRPLSPQEVAARATAATALPDPKVEPRFYALPANDHTFVFLNHGGLPGNWFLFRLPEYAYRSSRNRPREARNVRWLWEAGGWTYTWAVEEAAKKRALLDFTGRIIPGKSQVMYVVTARNPGAKPWPWPQMDYQCMRCADAPQFHDFEATRTFVRKGGQFVTVLKAMGGKIIISKRGDSRVGGAPGKLFARQSANGKRVVAVITDNAQSTVGNFADTAYCMHSNPVWGCLEPGESKTIHGCAYLIAGKLNGLWEHVQRDFAIE